MTPAEAKEHLGKLIVKSPDKKTLSKIPELPPNLQLIAYELLGRDSKGAIYKAKDPLKNKPVGDLILQVEKLRAPQRKKLFQLFCGSLAPLVQAAWNEVEQRPYLYLTGSWNVKPFRTSSNHSAFAEAKHALLFDTNRLVYSLPTIDLSAVWLAQWYPHFGTSLYIGQDTVFSLLIAALNQNNKESEEVLGILIASGNNEHEIGIMGNHVVHALLGANRPEGWEYIRKMLLAAQRQEGLRQVIIEGIGKAHPDALVIFFNLIQDENLLRFSSVLYSLSEVLGFNWDAKATKDAKEVVSLAVTYLGNNAKQKKALSGDNPKEIFMALWAMSVVNADSSLPFAENFINHSSAEVRMMAVLHLCRIELPQTTPVLIQALDDPELPVACEAATGIDSAQDSIVPTTMMQNVNHSMYVEPSHGEEEKEEEATSPEVDERLFDLVVQLVKRLPGKKDEMETQVWGSPFTVNLRVIPHLLLNCLGNRPATSLLDYTDYLNYWQHEKLIQKLSKEAVKDSVARAALLNYAGERSEYIYSPSLTCLEKLKLQEDDLITIEALLTRQGAKLRQKVIRSSFKTVSVW